MKIAVYGMTPWEQEELKKLPLREAPEYVFVDDILREKTLKYVEGCQAVSILSNSVIDDKMAASLKEMGVSFVTTRSTGIDHIHKDAVKKYGLGAANVPSYSPASISEHTILLILSLLRKMKRNQEMVRACNYRIDGIRGKELGAMTVGVMGSGRIGAITIRILAGFGCRVLVCDPYESEAVKQYGTYVSKEELCKQADLIVLHCPLMESTYHVVDRDFLAGCKDGAILVNTARGGLMDAAAVLDSLKSGKLSAFAFDVYEGEDDIVRKDFKGRYPDDPVFTELCQMENVVYTAHVSFFTDEAARELVRISTENAVDFLLDGSTKNSIL